jgi:molybdate transport system regulatory protein
MEAIDRTGSISAAAGALGMSYRRAWMLVAAMNRCFLPPLVATSPHRRQGAALTPAGRIVLRLYRRIEARSRRAAQRDLAELRRRLNPGLSARMGARRPGGAG